MKVLSSIVLVFAVALAPACKKKEADPPAPTPPPTAVADAAPPADAAAAAVAPPDPTPTGSATAPPAEDPNAEFIAIYANHAEKKPNDPVVVKFEKFTVKKAKFDPKNLEGGTATIELDLASLKSDSDKRDGHLKSPDYIDLAKFTTATIDVANVKKKDDKSYTADAKVKFRDIDKTYPVTFEVVETGADFVKIKGAQTFARADFKVGKLEPGPTEGVAKEIELRLQLTLKKT